MKKIFYLLPVIALVLAGCKNNQQAEQSENVPERIIFETDMGNDVDDALAADLLYKYMKAGKIDLLAVMLNKAGVHQAEFMDALNTWYGFPEIPIGIIRQGADPNNNADTNFAAQVALMQNEAGEWLYKRSLTNHANLPEACVLYRKLLAEQPDASVTIISVGFSTNLARLLDSDADDYSPLSGKELVAQKVKRLINMAGNMESDKFYEYNVVIDVPAAQKVFHEWPTPVITSPWELGNAILYPASSIENDFAWAPNHPVVDAYKCYLPMPYDRPTWDVTSTLYALEGDQYFTVSPAGKIQVTDAGATLFTPDENGNRYYLTVTPEQKEAVLNYFVTEIPKEVEK